ncbi:PQQ-dependent sugar dehydrogenase [Dinghuibacter silviterrae]|uniref:Glucose/arabinose dehydrogenase n=1 Tax=Dinghuibacter silviterrae TaxID=1539049 RepID=A0A4R8DYR3_9BACT|nr:PQQ-dependent sugar dehydrogenase [Dinghuibacter silviterrae]TDX02351.1 glucose/arabinose dehydrogenase [Dinghuibacter silviterrae]
MKRYLPLFLLLAACHTTPSRVLILSFSQTEGHPDSVRLIKTLDSMKVRLDTTTDPTRFTDSTLTRYTAVVLLDADGDMLPFASRVALKRFLEAGGGLIRLGHNGVTDYDWNWYKRLIKGDHPYGDRVYNADTLFKRDSLARVFHAVDGLNYGRTTTVYPPVEAHFKKVPLVQGQIFEPTEMTVLPNLDVLFLQRRGEVMLYKNATHQLKQAGLLGVYFHTDKPGVNVEEGMLGLCKDPDYAENHWVYIYYSVLDSPFNRLSRFTFANDTLDPATEKPILEVHTTRDICCHTGGSIAFNHDGLLFLSTGDNSTPFDKGGARFVSHGFAPLDQVPGDQQYDAERSAGNTNDLRGKILRIRVHNDGSYTIPEGNLFKPGTPNTRPEIYVMGDRNPYRISVDQANSFLYWGEVGPDAGSDSLGTRGPRGYDEYNQARAAGNFGWPFFVGNNLAYHAYDYTNGVPGPAFDPQHPRNTSPNNTGLTDLPPAQNAFIWYPYGNSPEFPEVGNGGRTAMAGPVYHCDDYPEETRYPSYYDGKLFIYEWMRDWMMAVTMNDKGDLMEMEPFLPKLPIHHCIDLEVGPDGRFYMLEYGTGWFTKNPDAGLYRLDYDTSFSATGDVASPDGTLASNNPVIQTGRALVQNLDCKSCHQENGKSIGPSFLQVSEKYADHTDVDTYLTQKVIRGGSGVWGDVAMAAHPDINKDDLHKVIQYILALSGEKKGGK